MSPENKGLAIGNTPELACAHNSHAMTLAKRRLDKSSGISTGRFTGEAFHFVSFVPIDGHLFELDGLKPFPMNHGPWKENEDWTDKFRITMEERLGISSGEQDIRFNLMAVVPDRRIDIQQKLKNLEINIKILTDTLEKLVQAKQPAAVAKSVDLLQPKVEREEESEDKDGIEFAAIKSKEYEKANDNDDAHAYAKEVDGTVTEEGAPEINILHQLTLQSETLVCVWGVSTQQKIILIQFTDGERTGSGLIRRIDFARRSYNITEAIARERIFNKRPHRVIEKLRG